MAMARDKPPPNSGIAAKKSASRLMPRLSPCDVGMMSPFMAELITG
jgi:hypothetical protein